jgi:hypothetical protein
MHPDSIDVVIRQTASEFGGDIVELLAFRAVPSEEAAFEPGETSDALREFVFRNGGTRFTFEVLRAAQIGHARAELDGDRRVGYERRSKSL